MDTERQKAATFLRQKAEDLLKKKSIEEVSTKLSEEEIQKIIHELQICQLEIEIQNEELVKAKSAVQNAVDIYDFAPLGNFTISKESEIILLNISAAKMLGKERSQLIGNKFSFFVSNDTKPVFNLFIENIFTKKTQECCDLSFLTDRDFPKYVHLVGILSPNGEHCFVTVIDITDRKQEEDALMEREVNYRIITENVNDMITRHTPEGVYTYLTPSCQSILGYQPHELIGINPYTLFHPDDVLAVQNTHSTVIKNEDVNLITYRIKRKDGRYVWIETNNKAITDPISGKVKEIICISRDITESKEAEIKLQLSELKYKNLVENAMIGIYSTNLNGDFLFANNAMCNILEYDTIDELLNSNVRDVYKDKEERVSFVDLILKSGRVFNYELELKTKQNRKIHVLLNSFYTGDVITGMMMDITERKQAESLLQDIIDKNPISIQIVDNQGLTLRVNPAHTKLFGSVPPSDFSIFDDLQSKNKTLEKLISHAKRGEVVHLPNMYYNAHDVDPKFHDVPVWIHALIFPIEDNYGNLRRYVFMHEDITARKHAEDLIKSSEERYQTFINSTDDITFLKDENLRYQIINQATIAFFGKKKEEIIGSTDFELMDEKSANFCLETDKKITRDNKLAINEELIKGRTYETHKFPVKMINGSIGVGSIIRDITDRKQAEKALRESELRYRTLFRISPMGIIIMDENGIILEANETITKITLYSNDELIGKDIRLFTTEETKHVVSENILRIIKGETLETEVLNRRKDGSTRVFLLKENVITLPNGRPGILSVSSDITERKQAEEELRESEEWNKVILQTILSGVVVIDVDTCTIVEVNDMALELIGLSKEEVIGKSCHKFICPAEKNNCPILNNGKTVDLSEKKLLTADGTSKDIIKSVVPIQFRGRKFLIESFVDITELKKAQEEIKLKNEELLKINSEKDKFFSIIAHDLRSPFNSFLGLTQVMAEELPSLTKDEIQKFAISMRKSATNLFRLLENLLEWSRIQQGLIPFTQDYFQLFPIISESIEMVIESAKNKEIKISYDIPTGLEVFADDNILQTIIRNLVSNAIKFTPKGGQIIISAKSVSDNFVEIALKDTGIGLDKLMVDNLFRLDINTSRKGTEGEPSTGLGLIICKDFIEKHKGKLWVESEKGKGSTFYFTLPNKPQIDKNVHSKNNKLIEDTENQLKNLKILIAEDDEVSAMIITMLLKRFSMEVLVAKNGFEAVEICRNNTDIDLILMDIQMPEMDGYEATKQIRKFNTDIIIIAQTAHAFSKDKEKAIELGCNDYLTKPINDEELKQTIVKLLKTN